MNKKGKQNRAWRSQCKGPMDPDPTLTCEASRLQRFLDDPLALSALRTGRPLAIGRFLLQVKSTPGRKAAEWKHFTRLCSDRQVLRCLPQALPPACAHRAHRTVASHLQLPAGYLLQRAYLGNASHQGRNTVAPLNQMWQRYIPATFTSV
jgi:hypothetical protein